MQGNLKKTGQVMGARHAVAVRACRHGTKGTDLEAHQTRGMPIKSNAKQARYTDDA